MKKYAIAPILVLLGIVALVAVCTNLLTALIVLLAIVAALAVFTVVYLGTMSLGPQFWPQIQEVNEFLREYCAQYDNIIFVDGNAPLRNPDGTAKEELFRKDKLHLNHDGQLLWGKAMRPILEQIHAPK